MLEQKALDFLMKDLVGVDKKASTFIVYLYLYSRDSSGGKAMRVSLRELSSGTGLSKRSVQTAIRHLASRSFLEIEREGPTTIPEYRTLRPWEETKAIGRKSKWS